jgi:hypothetical protein
MSPYIRVPPLVVFMSLFAGETTGWEDIQIKMGNFAPRDPKGPSNDEVYAEAIDRADGIVKQDFVNTILKGEQTKNDADFDSDLAFLRRQRIEQLMNQESQTVVRRITRETYMDEVTEGSKTAAVVVMMDRHGGTSFMESECKKFAQEWVKEIAPAKGCENARVRFYVGDVDDLISNDFPSESLPFAVVYAAGTCQAQLARATTDGIKTALLISVRIMADEKTRKEGDDEGDAVTRDIRKEIALRKQIRKGDESASDSSDDVSDDESKYQRSKGYSSTYFAKNILRQ